MFPERSLAPEQLVRLARDESFPALQHPGERCSPNLDQHMDMIWHHDPSQQLVSLSVEMTQRALGQPGNRGLTQPAFAMAAVEKFLQFQTSLAVVLDSQQRLPLAPSAGGHGIMQPERDELREARSIAMGQITSLVPAEETLGFGNGVERVRP